MEALRRFTFQLDPVERDTESCHLRRRIGSFRDVYYMPDLEHGLYRVQIALIGERAGSMGGDAVSVELGGQFRCRYRVPIAGQAGIRREVAEERAVPRVLVSHPDLYQDGNGGGRMARSGRLP